MKIKYNIPKINEIKENLKNIRSKIINNKRKVPMKYYAILILMILVGVITFSSNVSRYNNITSEKYTKYELNDWIKVDSNKVEIETDENKIYNNELNYEIYDNAISSISTNIANLEINDYNSSYLIKGYIWPVIGEVVKEYAIDDLVYSKTLDMWRTHPGIDILADIDDEVLAVQDGKVIAIEEDSFYGNTVKIEHDDGYVSIYSNLGETYDLRKGSKIKQGEAIGKVGFSSQGEIEDKIHLHFEILKDNEWVNPLDILE